LALKAFGKKLEITSNNISNVDTGGFKKSRALLQETFPTGVTVSINRINTPGAPIFGQSGVQRAGERSNVDIGEETVQLVTTRAAYTANLKTLKTGDEILGTLLDVVD
jgi:flagellar basal-body rod protein FlgC